jgi:hypothetical protein
MEVKEGRLGRAPKQGKAWSLVRTGRLGTAGQVKARTQCQASQGLSTGRLVRALWYGRPRQDA